MLLFKRRHCVKVDQVATVFAKEIQGENILITGTSVNGIGFETARVLAKHANLIIITGHNSERLKIAEDTIKSEAAAEINAFPEPLHVLIHNAAAVIGEFKLTVDNFENQFATNHLGPFLLTKLLSSKLLAARTTGYTPRHIFCDGVNFSKLERPDPDGYEPLDTYFRTKVANILTAMELSKRSKGQINAYSLHPGVIMTNNMQRGDIVDSLKKWTYFMARLAEILDEDGRPSDKKHPWKTIPQGAATTVAAAFDPNKPGAYLDDCVEANDTIAPHASDSGNAERLWALTERLIGESFTF
ncbi:hypothetical protein B0H13DRAFT_2066681 [Mycena leptocephala]|nr:hypothetical protein B0H13DRAFT_2066681 [Mycena leptocephala]